ncbi:uncharacterized protein [Oscarella lobularis]|uniref:uncharacterized protein n=1 Tax=Oscarella lobularis TaxID=121494 RepID=UPI00331377E5
MSEQPIPLKDEKNFYHPQSEQEIITLVKLAKEKSLKVRVRGSGHSMARAIFTDTDTGTPARDGIAVNEEAPDGKDINIVLDQYAKIISVDTESNLVTVQAGIHLGRDPEDPRSTLENSLLYVLHHTFGLTLVNLGGITHQTVGGFLMTGSSGGSLLYSVQDNVHALRFIDGCGAPYDVDSDEENFDAYVVSLGLLGVLSRVTFKCEKTFNIKGSQSVALTKLSSVDLFEEDEQRQTMDQAEKRPNLIEFLSKNDYARLLWWPQGTELLSSTTVWKAKKMDAEPSFKPNPHAVFDNLSTMVLYSYVMILLGNFGNKDGVLALAQKKSERIQKLKTEELLKANPSLCEDVAKKLAESYDNCNLSLLGLAANAISDIDCKPLIHFLTTVAIGIFNSIDGNVEFQDYSYTGLPMDNSADDVIVPVMWTEMWIPLGKATEAMKALREYVGWSIEKAGNNAWELYAAKPSKAWLSMSYTDGNDEWKDGAFRIDPYWCADNQGNFRDFYKPIWKCLKEAKIPFRLHWGKSFPLIDDADITREDVVTERYPLLKAFRDIQKKRDPAGVFLNDYWRHWLSFE